MSVADIFGFLKGYVVIRCEGCFTERFLNICMHRGILLRNIKRRGALCLDATISVAGFRELRPIAKKTKTRIKILSRHGMPFFLHRYRRRKFAVIGVLLFFAVLWYLSSHIMGIDITGNERLLAADIERELKGAGLYRGAATSRIEPKSVQNKMMTKFDDIAWIGVNIKGSRAYIEIRERLDTKRRIGTDIPCNLIASRDGIIRLLEVRAGQTAVKTGELVEKGDLLVSGILDSTKEGIRYAHSFGEVYADTSYELSRVYPLKYTEKIYTGETRSRYGISVFGKRINFFFSKNQPYEYCDKTEKSTEYSLLGKTVPPLGIHSESFAEYNPQKKTRTVQEAVALGKAELSAELKKGIPQGAEISKTEVTFKEVPQNGVEVTVKILCYENIAVQSEIDKTENMN